MSDVTKTAILDLLGSVFAALTVLGVTQLTPATEQWITGVVGSALSLFTLVVGHFTRKAALS